MANEIKNLSERPIDQIRRHETAIKLLEENADDQDVINQQLRDSHSKLSDELRTLRERYDSDQRMWKFGWQATRAVFKWGIYIVAAAVGWGWSHIDKVEAFFRPTEPK